MNENFTTREAILEQAIDSSASPASSTQGRDLGMPMKTEIKRFGGGSVEAYQC